MAQYRVSFRPAIKGLGNEFARSNQPVSYARELTNRFININGDMEKRRGMVQFGNTIEGQPSITGIHEYVDTSGNSLLFVSSSGRIYQYSESTGDYTLVHTTQSSNRLISVQMNDRLIFTNGEDRNFYRDNEGNFKELEPLIDKGTMGSGTNATVMASQTISNWVTETFISVHDLVHNVTTGAYGVVITLTTASPTTFGTTRMGGGGASGLGVATSANQSGHLYEIYDLVELNVIDTPIGKDNIAILTSGTTTSAIAVSAANWPSTEIRVGDIIYNTTRGRMTDVLSISTSALSITPIDSQVVGDSILLFKKSMPIATWPHVHYGRLYLIDERDRTQVRVSGINDAQDFTTYQKSLSESTISYGSRQPSAEKMQALTTFQRYLVAGGSRNVFVDDGTDPIRSTSDSTTNFGPVGLFNQALVSPYGMVSIGNLLLFAANDGVRAFGVGADFGSLTTINISEQIKSDISAAILSKFNAPEDLIAVHYPKRNWVLFKIGSTIYNYNYTGIFIESEIVNQGGSWSKFVGKFAEQKAFYVRQDGILLCAGDGGKVYQFDVGFADDGENIDTSFETPWMDLLEPEKTATVKQGVYIKPVFEGANGIEYTIAATGDFDKSATDSIVVTTTGGGFVIGQSAVGQSIINNPTVSDDKAPLRWRGEQFKLRFTTSDQLGPDVLSRYTVYGNKLGDS